MSFGDDNQGPITGLIGGTLKAFDQVLAPAFGQGPKASKPSVVNAPTTSPTPSPSTDTPGRHKSLLGQ